MVSGVDCTDTQMFKALRRSDWRAFSPNYKFLSPPAKLRKHHEGGGMNIRTGREGERLQNAVLGE